MLERARSLLDTDLTMSVAWLERLRTIPGGRGVDRGRSAERGVARRILTAHTDVLWSVVATREAIVDRRQRRGVRSSPSTEHAALPGHTDRAQALAVSSIT